MTTVHLEHDIIQPYLDELKAMTSLHTDENDRHLKLVLHTAMGVHMRLWLTPDGATVERFEGIREWQPGDLNDLDELLASAEDEELLDRPAPPHAMTPHRRIVREARRTNRLVKAQIRGMMEQLTWALTHAEQGEDVSELLGQVAQSAVRLAVESQVHATQLGLLEEPKFHR